MKGGSSEEWIKRLIKTVLELLSTDVSYLNCMGFYQVQMNIRHIWRSLCAQCS